jgi:hypothetical protein
VAIPLPRGACLYPARDFETHLFETKNFAGVTGMLTCNENGDCQPETRIPIYSIHEGAFFDEPSFPSDVRLEDL